MKNRQLLFKSMAIVLLISFSLNLSARFPHGPSVDFSQDGSQYTFKQSDPFPAWGAALISALCSIPLAVVLYQKYSPAKKLVVFNEEGIQLFEGTVIPWKDYFSAKEMIDTHYQIRWIEIRTEDDAKHPINLSELGHIGVPKFLKLIEYYRQKYQQKSSKPKVDSEAASSPISTQSMVDNEADDDFPNIDQIPYIDIAKDKSSTTMYRLKPGKLDMALSIIPSLLSIFGWYAWDSGRRERLILNAKEIRNTGIWFFSDQVTRWGDVTTVVDRPVQHYGEHGRYLYTSHQVGINTHQGPKDIKQENWGADLPDMMNLAKHFKTISPLLTKAESVRTITYGDFNIYNIYSSQDLFLPVAQANSRLLFTTFIVNQKTGFAKKYRFYQKLIPEGGNPAVGLINLTLTKQGVRLVSVESVWDLDGNGNLTLISRQGIFAQGEIGYTTEDIDAQTLAALTNGTMKSYAFNHRIEAAEIARIRYIDKPIERSYRIGGHTLYNIPDSAVKQDGKQLFNTFIVNNATKKVQRLEFYYRSHPDKAQNEPCCADFRFFVNREGLLIDSVHKKTWRVNDEGQLLAHDGGYPYVLDGREYRSWFYECDDLYERLNNGTLDFYEFKTEIPDYVKDFFENPQDHDNQNGDHKDDGEEDEGDDGEGDQHGEQGPGDEPDDANPGAEGEEA